MSAAEALFLGFMGGIGGVVIVGMAIAAWLMAGGRNEGDKE